MSILKAMWAKACLLVKEARSKVTTYVGLAIAGIGAAATHSEDLLSQWPTIAGYLPKGHALDVASHYAVSALGVLVAVMRVRRLVWPPKAST